MSPNKSLNRLDINIYHKTSPKTNLPSLNEIIESI
jgi:hypothetical protein